MRGITAAIDSVMPNIVALEHACLSVFHSSCTRHNAALDQPYARPTQDCVCGSQVVPGRQNSLWVGAAIWAAWGLLGEADIAANHDQKRYDKELVMCISRVCKVAVPRRLINRQIYFFSRVLCTWWISASAWRLVMPNCLRSRSRSAFSVRSKIPSNSALRT